MQQGSSTNRAEQARANKILTVYFEERRSLSETARQLAIKRSRVESVIKRAGLKLRPMGEGVRLSKLGRSRLKLSLRDHPKAMAADKWKIVELKVAGKSNQEIARLLDRAQPSIYYALRKIGFPGGTGVTACYGFGEVFDRSALRHLHEISGLNVTELAKTFGMPFATLDAALSRRKPTKQLHFKTARAALGWRGDLFWYLMSNASRHPGKQTTKYSQSRVLLTLFPNLRKKYLFLLEVLRQLAKKLRENPEWSRNQLQQYLCEQAKEESFRKNRGDLFIRFLPWAPELMPFLAQKLPILRGVHHQRLAWEVIAGPLCTTAPIISEIINPSQVKKINPIPPEQMRWLILTRQCKQPKVARKKSGRKKGMTAETQEDALLLEQYIRDFTKQHGTKRGALVYACRKVYGSTVESRKAVQRGNKTLSRYRAING
jgi:hypothetical protein